METEKNDAGTDYEIKTSFRAGPACFSPDLCQLKGSCIEAEQLSRTNKSDGSYCEHPQAKSKRKIVLAKEGLTELGIEVPI